MDKEPEELQFLGFFGIYREAYKIIRSWYKFFGKITLSLILPLSIVFLVQILISDALFTKIGNNEHDLDTTNPNSAAHERILRRISSEWRDVLLFKAAYLIALLIFSLLSTSAVVYTVACIYTAKDVSFKKVLSVVPKVWKRLLVTFLWNSIILFGYNAVSVVLIIIALVMISPISVTAATVTAVILIILYILGLVYISVIWHLASVVSVLEDKYGISAMVKSKELIKGKLLVSSAIFLKLSITYVGIQVLFGVLVVHGESRAWQVRFLFGVLLVILLSKLILLGLVIQTIIYFVCKSYHHENVDKSCLADHLEVYLGDYVPLKGKDVQLEQYYV